MDTINKTVGSGIINMVNTIDDYSKILRNLHEEARTVSIQTANECLLKLSPAYDLVNDCRSKRRKFDFVVEESIRDCVFATRDWLAAKTRTQVPSKVFEGISILYKWKLEKFQHRAWDALMTADNCEGLLIRLMERVCDESQNIAVVQVFLSIQELESCEDSTLRIETRLKDGFEKLKAMRQDNIPLIPLVGVVRN